MKPVLLLVDLQSDFLRAEQLEPHPAGIVAAATGLLDACRQAEIPVVHVWSTVDPTSDNRMPHWKEAGRWSCLEGSAGHSCPESLRPKKSEAVVHKTFFSGFSTDQLLPVLGRLNADLVILAGVHLHACVRATALDAYANGLRVIVADDATGSNDPLHAAITRRYLLERSIVFRKAKEISAALREKSPDARDSLLEETAFLFTHVSPQNPASRWTVRKAQKADVEAAAGKARAAFDEWRALAVQSRLTIVQKWAETLGAAERELVELLVEDIGKPVRYARAEVKRAIALIKALANQIEPIQEQAPEKTGYRREPHGVIGVLAPFNNPLAIPVGKIAPALLYGNVVIWKPALAGSRIARRAAQLFERTESRLGVLEVLYGGDETARNLMAACDAVTISGSGKAGRVAQEICSARHIPLQAELGGNNASIVWRDADFGAAAQEIAEGAFGFAGQRCTANRRVILDATIYDAFLEQLTTACAQLVWGDPADETTEVGPLITAESRERVAALIGRAGAESARVIRPLRNSRAEDRDDAWLDPAIVCCDEPAAEIVQEETFGPVLVVQRARTWDEAIALCNGVKQGLAAALFSTSPQLIEDFLRRTRAGILKINCSTADAAVDLPFGGWKASGVGPPEHGPGNREFYTRMQAIYLT